jgi:pimeloyl-ACP methyl ester carboxylesterase
MPASNPVIVVPGITATYLRDQYPISPETIWAVISKDYDRAALHPDDLRYEAQEPARVVADQLYEVAYGELIAELRYNLRDSEDETIAVYPFGYDWRQLLDVIEAQLADFIDEVIDRTKLQPHYHRAGFHTAPKVNLVGHSMGGLVIAGYLEQHGGEGKVATIASPFQGSFEAIIKVTTGTANLGTSVPSSREREAARLTPALYHLVPSFKAGVEIHPELPQSLFDPGVWQQSIIDTIVQSYRLRGIERGRSRAELRERSNRLFAEMLAGAARHRGRLDSFKLDNTTLSAEDWLCVIGTNETTRVALEVIKRGQSADFNFRSKDRDNLWDKGETERVRRKTGDGTVPFEGALPRRFLPYE